MAGFVRKATLLTTCGLFAASSALATTPGPPLPSACTVPCAIVLVGNNVGNTAADPFGVFTVVVSDGTVALSGLKVTVDFGGCCPGIKLSNTQLGLPPIGYPLPAPFLPAGTAGTHTANSSVVTGVTDGTGAVTFIVQGAGSGASIGTLVGSIGCATISVDYNGTPYLLTDGVDHPTVFVSTLDLGGVIGNAGVDVTDLSTWVFDKNAYYVNNADYHQRSDFDFHLPAYNCSAVFAPTSGFGVNVGDLAVWIAVKNSARSFANGPFPANCPQVLPTETGAKRAKN